MGSCCFSNHFRLVWSNVTTLGANCSIFGCPTSRRYSGLSIFKGPSGEDDLSRKTRKEWVNIITRNGLVDADLRRQIDEVRLRDFEEKFTERHATRKKLLPAVPSMNLPQKTFQRASKSIRAVKRHETDKCSASTSGEST